MLLTKKKLQFRFSCGLIIGLYAVHGTLSTNTRDRRETGSLETSHLPGVCLGQVIRKQCSVWRSSSFLDSVNLFSGSWSKVNIFTRVRPTAEMKSHFCYWPPCCKGNIHSVCELGRDKASSGDVPCAALAQRPRRNGPIFKGLFSFGYNLGPFPKSSLRQNSNSFFPHLAGVLKNLWKMFNKCLELYVNRKNEVICKKDIKEKLNIIQHFLY